MSKMQPVVSRSTQRRVASMKRQGAPDFSFDPAHYTISIRNDLIEGQWHFVARVQELPDVAVYEADLLRSYKIILDVIRDLRAVAKNDGHAFPEPIPLNLRHEPPHAQCSHCHRKTYDKYEFGSLCNRLLPGGGAPCKGKMRRCEEATDP